MTAPAPTGTPQRAGGTTLRARGIVKRFGDVLAVDHVDLDVSAGVHALLGENGAGKSTLVKVLYGYMRADEGTTAVDGVDVEILSPLDARRVGIGLVFQQSTLIPAFTVAENIALFLPDLPAVISHRDLAARITSLSQRYGLEVQPERMVGTLSVPEQQRVEIVRVLLAGARVLIFDEPTSTLPAHEIEGLFTIFRRLVEDGFPIVFITHKLHEVLSIADRVTVMRKGAVVQTLDVTGVTEDHLVELMFGSQTVHESEARSTAEAGEVVLELSGVSTRGTRPLVDLNLTVRAGELVGVAGISGNGQRELGDVLAGLVRPAAGKRLLFGKDSARWSVRRVRDSGIGFIPEDVAATGVIWNLSLAENLALGSLHRFAGKGLGVDWRRVREDLHGHVEELGLHLPDANRRAGTLSGGNVQRFVVARELARDPALLVALYPTRGLDVPTASAVQKLLLLARDRGAGVLVVSHDLAELMDIADRIVVLRDGRFVADVRPSDTDPYRIGLAMTGGETP